MGSTTEWAQRVEVRIVLVPQPPVELHHCWETSHPLVQDVALVVARYLGQRYSSARFPTVTKTRLIVGFKAAKVGHPVCHHPMLPPGMQLARAQLVVVLEHLGRHEGKVPS